jgi:TolA-binding protein
VSDTPKRWLEGGADAGEDGAAKLLEQSQPMPEADDLSQERVWRQITRERNTERPTAKRWVLAAAMAVLALVAGALVVRGWPTSSSARLELTAGSVLSAVPSGSWTGAEAGGVLPERSRLKTAARAQAVLKLERAAALVAPGSDVGLESIGPQTFIRLAGGEIVSEVEPRRSGEAYVIQTTRYRVTVKGTVFAVRERAPDDVTVSVSRGLVEVAGEGGTWLVAAGRSWESKHPDAVGADDIRASERELLSTAMRPGPRASVRVEGDENEDVSEGGVLLGPAPVTWSAPVGRYHFVAGTREADVNAESGAIARVTLTPRPLGSVTPEVPEVDDERDLEPEPEAAAPAPQGLPEPKPKAVRPAHRTRHAVKKSAPAVEPEPAVETAPIPERAEKLRDTTPAPSSAAPASSNSAPPGGWTGGGAPAGSTMTGDTPPIPRAEPPHTQQQPSPVTDAMPAAAPEDVFKQAVAYSRAGLYAEAATAFEAVINAHGPRAELAIIELGRLQQLHLGLADKALATYLRYQREYPHGTFLQEVALDVIELQLQRHELDAAREQMNKFLDRFSKSERAPEVHLLRGDVLREQGDCRHAIDDYAKATAPAQADDALYFTAWCQQRLSRRDEAAAGFAEYLRRFPEGRHAAQARAALPASP